MARFNIEPFPLYFTYYPTECMLTKYLFSIDKKVSRNPKSLSFKTGIENSFKVEANDFRIVFYYPMNFAESLRLAFLVYCLNRKEKCSV